MNASTKKIKKRKIFRKKISKEKEAEEEDNGFIKNKGDYRKDTETAIKNGRDAEIIIFMEILL